MSPGGLFVETAKSTAVGASVKLYFLVQEGPADQMPHQCSSVANLFPVRPGVTLLFVFLSSQGFHAKALRALVADGDF